MTTATLARTAPRPRVIRAWLDKEAGTVYVFGTGDRGDAIHQITTEGVHYVHDDGSAHTFRPLLDPYAARTGWFRVVPGCPSWCGLGHPCHYYESKPFTRGAFPYVAWWLWRNDQVR